MNGQLRVVGIWEGVMGDRSCWHWRAGLIRPLPWAASLDQADRGSQPPIYERPGIALLGLLAGRR